MCTGFTGSGDVRGMFFGDSEAPPKSLFNRGGVGQMGTSDGYVLLEETFVHWFHWFQERSMKPHFLKIV